MNEAWLLETRNGVKLTYTATDDMKIDFSAMWETDDFPIGESDLDGQLYVVGEEGVNAMIGVPWQATEWLSVRPFAAYKFARDLEFRTNNQQVAEINLDGAWQVGIGLKASW